MKTTKYFLSMAALALVGAMTVSCSSDDNITDQPQQQEVTKSNVVTLTTTVSLDGGATTRALSIEGNKGVKTFAAGETMAIYYWKNKGNDHVKAVSAPLTAGDITNGGKSATFTFTLDNPYKDMSVVYTYPAAMANADFTPNYDALYNNQDGTRATLASDFDFCTKSGAWAGDNLPSLTLENQLAILAITLKNEAGTSDITSGTTKLTVSDGTNTYNVNRSAAEGPIYVAIRPTTSATIDITATSGGKGYYKTLTTTKSYAASNGYPVSWKMTQGANLSKLTAAYTAQNGDKLTGTLGSNVKISIADGASVTLKDVTINGENNESYKWAGITCEGDATIILSGTNTVNGFYEDYPGVFVPSGSTLSTLTIQGTGVLNASSNGYGAGIGGGNQINCGNIVIKSGTINATGGKEAAGIGSSDNGECGDITINGGIVTATGGEYADGIGIGRGMSGKCGDITINGGSVTARGGSNGAGIGGWSNGSSRTTINITGGNVVATGGEKAAGIGSGDDLCCNINISGGAGTATKGAGAECSIGRAIFFTDYDDPSTNPCGTISISGIVGVGVSTYTLECTSETCTWQNSNP